ncbi:hypothetical protein ACFQVC_13060 [Streptomyces monticola]|uniref:WXG100 family type VII secretion target n=1 Tax=Streptomyces monticola TaxID=2666263 RepID=A0ABW2JHE6_9ACTN
MTFDDEWAELKQGAAARMQLAGTGWSDNSGGGGGELRTSKAAWTKAGEGVNALRGDIKKALTRLGDSQKGTGQGGGEIASVGAQRELHDSWQRYLTDVSNRCGTLRDLFEKASAAESKNDEAVKDVFSAVRGKYGDTPAVGGSSKER